MKMLARGALAALALVRCVRVEVRLAAYIMMAPPWTKMWGARGCGVR